MSKIEEALEKANELRGGQSLKEHRKINIAVNVEPSEVNNHCLVTVTQPDSPVAEEYRRLKSMLIRDTKPDFLNTIMISSAVDSEGKTLTAINLAITLAQELDHSILLIDADMRKPMVHKYLGLEYKHGLSDYLKGEVEISDVLINTGIGNLVVLPAGRPISNPVELHSSDRMKALLKEVKHRYMDRYVIIDTPPILPFADAIVLGSFVDGVLLVVKEGRAQKKLVDNALHLIKDMNILGVVFNSVREANLDGHYSRYYHYGYSKYGYSGYKRKEVK